MGRADWTECRFGFQQCFDDLTEVRHASEAAQPDQSVSTTEAALHTVLLWRLNGARAHS